MFLKRLTLAATSCPLVIPLEWTVLQAGWSQMIFVMLTGRLRGLPAR